MERAEGRFGTGKTENWRGFTGFRLEEVATGFLLPVNLVFVPQPNASFEYVKGYVAFACAETDFRTERST